MSEFAAEHEAEEVTELVADEPPKSGEFIETCDVFENVDPEVIADGKALGETVNELGDDEEPEQ